MWPKLYRTQLIILATLGVLSLILSLYAHRGQRFPADLYLAVRIQSLDGNLLLEITRWVSFIFGGWRSVAVVLALTVVLVWRAGPLEAAAMVMAGTANLLNIVFKIAVNRARPAPDLLDVLTDEASQGFPSGHSCFSILILGLLVYFAVVQLKNRLARTLIVGVLVWLILLVGFSRIFLGVHWPSDVLGGYLVGGFLLTFVVIFYEILRRDAQVHRRWWSR